MKPQVLRIVGVKVIGRSNLLAVVDCPFGGLEACGVAVLHGPSGLFITMPLLDGTGRHRRDKTGRGLYDQNAIVRWTDPECAADFRRALLGVLARDHPAVFNGSSPRITDRRGGEP
jgi:hypothetical protein